MGRTPSPMRKRGGCNRSCIPSPKALFLHGSVNAFPPSMTNPSSLPPALPPPARGHITDALIAAAAQRGWYPPIVLPP